MRQTILVYGDNQAEAVSIILKKLTGIAQRFDVAYVSESAAGGLTPEDVANCRYLCAQSSKVPFPHLAKLSKACRVVTFPLLDCELLWPLATVNPYNRPELPSFPSGKFPYGNSFIINCIEQDIPPQEILDLYLSGVWFDTWPNLDRLFVAETGRLFARDAECTVQMGAFVLKHFCRERLFSAPRNPTDKLLCELIVRILDACFESAAPASPQEVAGALASLGARDLLGMVGVPVHPKIAEHFGLSWYHPGDRYNLFDVERVTYDEYFEAMIESGVLAKRPRVAGGPIKRIGKRTLIIYGNCQSEAISLMLAKLPRIAERFEIVYLRSFEHPSDGWQQIEARQVANCTLLLEQHDVRAFPQRSHLAAEAKVLKFPALDFNLLWPFNRVNPYNVYEPPHFPFGRFSYGDRIIVDCIDKGMAPDDILEYYLNRWDDYAPDLDRLCQLEAARLAARDRHCDLKMGRFVMDEFRNAQLFWTVNHPTSGLLAQVIVQLVNVALAGEVRVSVDEVAEKQGQYFAKDPLGALRVPIHPRVAEHFELTWYDPNDRYGASADQAFTYVEYFRKMIKSSLTVKYGKQAV